MLGPVAWLTEQEVVEKSEEEIAAALERRREHGKRLQEMQSKQRAEKVILPERTIAADNTACGENGRARGIPAPAIPTIQHEEGRFSFPTL